ncbi:alpha/beta-hydrolase [Auricularia subglabra TFB-10046 SS5]|nr:alpha/beta-hydrolase [Auricularia subglabra TFB-10046 SS5]
MTDTTTTTTTNDNTTLTTAPPQADAPTGTPATAPAPESPSDVPPMSATAVTPGSTPPSSGAVSTEALPRAEPAGAVPKLHKVSKRSPFGALLSRTLPAYTGPYQVGVCDVEFNVPAPRTFGNFVHKKLPIDGEAGLLLKTVMFSLFYPAQVDGKPAPVVWFPNLRQTIDGFLKMANRTPNIWYRAVAYPAAAAAIWGTTFPAHKDAPLLEPPAQLPDGAAPLSEDGRWPLVVFSHGVGCSRLMYSAFCGELASRGYVVAALEHRDGTSPSSLVTTADGVVKRIDWLQWSDLEWPDLPKDAQPKDDTTLRHEQIKMRAAEVFEVIRGLDRASKGEPPAKNLNDKRWRWLDATRPHMTGHSLGGACALAAAAINDLPFRSVVAFDPAVQRLAPWRDRLPHPLLVINSEEFAVGREWALFAEQIAGWVLERRPEVFTISGATHPAFSDVFLILPGFITRATGMLAPADVVVETAVDATLDWLRDGSAERTRARARKYEKGEAPLLEVKGPAAAREDRKEVVAKPTRKVGKGKLGELVWHEF